MAAKRLFKTAIREEAHAELERVLASGKHPLASCRENAADSEPYSVWDGPAEAFTLPPEAAVASSPASEDELLDKLLDKLLARLEARSK